MSQRVHRFLNNSGIATNPTAAPAKKGSPQSSAFSDLKVAPPNELFNTVAKWRADPDPKKINLGIGAYRTDEGKPYILNVVKKAEKAIYEDKALNKEYLPIAGFGEFIQCSQKLIFGKDSPVLAEKRVAGCQSLSGTGGLRTLFDFIRHFLPGTTVYISRPTWPNHPAMLEECGLKWKSYAYWNAKTRSLDIDGMLADLQLAPAQSVILLHSCAHNPTGVDPTPEQWKAIMEVCKAKKHIPFFDSAYQGFATGDLDNDAYAVRLFAKEGFEMFVSQSFAKNMGLYAERIGCASVVCKTPDRAVAVNSQLEIIVRTTYSNPPVHGALIASHILSKPELYEEWKAELKVMSGRIKEMRTLLFEALKRMNTPSPSGDWSHIVTQIGMFSFTGLSAAQVDRIVAKHHVYMLRDGRISVAGINKGNVQHLAQAIDDVVRNTN